MAENIEYGTTGKPHPYHIVRPSVWPLVGAFAGGLFAIGMVMFMHGVEVLGMKPGIWGPVAGVMAILLVMFFWWKDVIFEAVTEKAHTPVAKIGMRYGMALFISSEVMFFVAFFWAFFNASLFPVEAIGNTWPPVGMEVIPPFELPLLMTLILLLSGCTTTWAHHAIMEGHQKEFIKALGITVALGFIFLCFQVFEYVHAHFGFGDNVYTSAFFMATGFTASMCLSERFSFSYAGNARKKVISQKRAISVSKPRHGIGTLLTWFGSSCLFPSIGGATQSAQRLPVKQNTDDIATAF